MARYYGHRPYNKFYQTPYKKTFALALRNNPTPPEEALWQRLKNGQIKNNRFVRQKVIYGYIVDFYSHYSHLAIEVDGKHHENTKEYDTHKDRVLNKGGIYVLRVSANDVFNNIEPVVQRIEKACRLKP